MQHKIVRSLCYFSRDLTPDVFTRLDEVQNKLSQHGYTIQTRRICTAERVIDKIEAITPDPPLFFCLGGFDRQSLRTHFDSFLSVRNVTLHLDVTTGVAAGDAEILFDIISRAPENTFNFAYLFNPPSSSPFFPCAAYREDGLALGLQATDLSEGCRTLAEWLERKRLVWRELTDLFQDQSDFLGIDSTVAPMFRGNSSLIHFMKRLWGSFSNSVTTDTYLQITNFIQRENPRPVGLCGLMLPCLEDFELAEEYEAGNFSIERNIFLSMHCGLGVDTYPIGIDESRERVLKVLTLLHGLSTKYQKPLMARFVSDGRAKVGDMTSFDNPFLKDVVVRAL